MSLQVGLSFEEWYPVLCEMPLVTDSEERNPVHWSGGQSCEIREADGVYIRDPECLLFKEWAREDLENSSMGRGFLFTAVAYTRADNAVGSVQYFFALDPEKAYGAHLYNVWAALQFAEVAALRQGGFSSGLPGAVRLGFAGRAGDLASSFADPWFDGADYRATIVVSPYRAVLPAGQMADLTDDGVVRVVVRELELCAYLGPASLVDYSLAGRDRSLADSESEPQAQPQAEVIRRTLDVEAAPQLELLPEYYRFGKVQLDDRQNLSNRRFA